MSRFMHAMKTVLEHEGVDADDADDSGGRTRYGISLGFLRGMVRDEDGDGFADGDLDHDGDIDADDVALMTLDKATGIYRSQWWDRYRYSRIVDNDVATKVFDHAIPMGPRQAHKCTQRALRAVGIRVTVDGILGPQTFAAMNASSPTCLLVALRSELAGTFRLIVAKKPRNVKFLRGWLNRAYS